MLMRFLKSSLLYFYTLNDTRPAIGYKARNLDFKIANFPSR